MSKGTIRQTKLTWQPSMNGVTVNAYLDVAVHQGGNKTVVLIVPGIDGTIDGYDDKYLKMAQLINDVHGYNVVRISNPFISSFHWEDNIRKALEFIRSDKEKLFVEKPDRIYIVAHSAGASVAAWIAFEKPDVKGLVLINMAYELKPEKIEYGLNNFNGKVDLVYGSKDPSLGFGVANKSRFHLSLVEGADHYFSNEHISSFINIPASLLADTRLG